MTIDATLEERAAYHWWGVRYMSVDTSFEDFAATAMPRLRRLGYAVSHDWHRADDLVQETLQRVYAAWPRLRRDPDTQGVDGGPYGYARTVLVRRFISEQRQPWRRHEHSAAPTDEVIWNHSAPGASSATDTVGQRVDLLVALAALPPRQRVIAVLRYVEELSVEETAEVMGCGEGTVKSQAHHARRALRARLQADPPGDVTITETPTVGKGPR